MNSGSQSSSTFKVVFEGDGLLDNAMVVRDLIPALQGADELVRRSNELLNADTASVTLRAQPPQPGSFELSFALECLQVTAMALGGAHITSAVNLQRVVFGGASPGVLSLLKKLRGRRHRKTTDASDNDGSVVIEADKIVLTGIGEAEGFRASIPSNVVRLLEHPGIRSAASQLVSPLRQHNIERMAIRDDTDELESFDKSDLPSFEAPAMNCVMLKSFTCHQVLGVVGPYLGVQNRKWRLSEGKSVNSYSIKDEAFIRQVRQRARSFAAGDNLLCEVKYTRHILNEEIIKTDLDILTVIGDLPPGEQGTQLGFYASTTF